MAVAAALPIAMADWLPPVLTFVGGILVAATGAFVTLKTKGWELAQKHEEVRQVPRPEREGPRAVRGGCARKVESKKKAARICNTSRSSASRKAGSPAQGRAA
jgi:hypothetical protein